MAKKEQETIQSAETQQPNPSISLQDLILCAQIIQIGTQRGTFRAEELTNVGNLYTKLVSFLEASGAVTRAPAEGTQQETQND